MLSSVAQLGAQIARIGSMAIIVAVRRHGSGRAIVTHGR